MTPASLGINNIYTADGSLTAARTVTMGANTLTFSSTSGNMIFNPSLSTAKVGLGTSSPNYLLDVNGVINAAAGFKVGGLAVSNTFLKGNGFSYASATISTSDIPSLSATYVDLTSTQTASGFKTWSSNASFNGGNLALGNGTSNIISYNNVGTGPPTFTTRSAGAKLVLNSQLTAISVDYAIGLGSNTMWYSLPQANSSYNHAFYGGTTELMRIQGDGKVGIGTTSPLFQLTLAGGANSPVLAFDNMNSLAAKNAGGGYEVFMWPRWSDNIMYMNYGSVGFNIGSSSASTMFMTSGGNVGIGTISPTAMLSVNGTANNSTGSWGVFSDVRVKDVRGDFTDGLNVINKIHTIRYNYKANAPFCADGEQIGVIAQELERIAPYMVSKKEGAGFTGLREVNNQAYVFLLINAVKEQQAQIEALQNENSQIKNAKADASVVDQLKAEIEMLKAAISTSNK